MKEIIAYFPNAVFVEIPLNGRRSVVQFKTMPVNYFDAQAIFLAHMEATPCWQHE